MQDCFALCLADVRQYRPDLAAVIACAPPAARQALIALAALDAALLAIPGAVSEPLLAEIRYAWWYEALEALHETPRAHPVLEALLESGFARQTLSVLLALIAARQAEAEGGPEGGPEGRAGDTQGTRGLYHSVAALLLARPADEREKSAAAALGMGLETYRHWCAVKDKEQKQHYAAASLEALDRFNQFDSRVRQALAPLAAAAAGLRTHMRRGRPLAGPQRALAQFWCVVRARV